MARKKKGPLPAGTGQQPQQKNTQSQDTLSGETGQVPGAAEDSIIRPLTPWDPAPPINNDGTKSEQVVNPPIQFSVVTKTDPRRPYLTKIMRLKNGTLEKDSSQCRMSSGTIEIVSVRSPAEFAILIRSLSASQALVHGISKQGYANAYVFSKEKQESTGIGMLDKPIISRTLEHIHYPAGPGLFMLDHDKARDHAVAAYDNALQSCAAADLIRIISTVFPAIINAAWVATPSTSSCIFGADGNELRGEGAGAHIYFFPRNAQDVPRFLKILGQRLFLAGYGRIEVSRSGALLFRTLVDLSVGSPERLDFVAGAVCMDGLCQKLPAPTVHEGAPDNWLLDTEAMPDLSAAEAGHYAEALRELTALAKPRQESVRTEYHDAEAVKLAEQRNIDKDAARRIVTARQNHVLEDEDLLYFAHQKGRPVTVAELLDAGAEYNNRPLADPLEPDYDGGSMTKAKFFWNNGRRPKIHSFAHGETIYSFQRFSAQGHYAQKDPVQAAADAAVLKKMLEAVETDCGAPYQQDAKEALSRLQQLDKPEYMRTRAKLKKINPQILLGEMEKDIAAYSREANKFTSSQSSLSSFLSSYPSLHPALLEKIHNFQAVLVREGKQDDELCPHSEAALLMANELRGMYAHNSVTATWYRFEGSYWREIKPLEMDEGITALLYAGAGSVGFSNSYQSGCAALLQKGSLLPLPEQNRGGIVPFENGLLDLATREFVPTTTENALTWRLPYNYDPEAQCPSFTQWLLTALDGDKETARLLQAFLNAILTSRADLQKFLHLIGPAGTGKSTFGRLAFQIVGPENSTTTTLKQLEQNRFETAGIHGKRLVCIEEADKYGGNISVLKAMTGQDPLRLERKNQQQCGNFIYGGQVLMMSNERLATTDYTSGIERRRVTVEFTRRITPEERAAWDKRGGEAAILHAEIPGIINWVLELTREEVTDAFKVMPERVRRANLDAALFNNPLADWMLDACIPDPGAMGKVGDGRQVISTTGERIFLGADENLYANYLLWCQRSGREKVSTQRFSKTLEDAAQMFGVAVQKHRTSAGVHIKNLRLRREGEPSWRERLDHEGVNEGESSSPMKDNLLKMQKMKGVKVTTLYPCPETNISTQADNHPGPRKRKLI